MVEQGDPVIVRPMTPADVPDAERLSAEAFLEVERRHLPRSLPEPQARPADRGEAWARRTLHLLRTDPGGCWVAEEGDALIGFAASFVRETTWFLATYAVAPGRQGRGTGLQLLAAAMHHGRACLHGMVSAMADPQAARRYRLAGFTLHPQMHLTGTVDRAAIPVIEKVRDGSGGDIDLMDSVDRATRGAGHGPDHELLLGEQRLLVSDTTTGSGYVYVEPNGWVSLLAATNRRTAARLLWAALAESQGPIRLGHVTAANAWALDVGLAARLELGQGGYLALRGMRPPAPYLHHGALL
ncbi:GNAT family N-acetyltransferase [Nocardioides ochotonae]|uniref:GNAT family N-acetyltransferase n=1 Tax=Nocardioides ochotonae TaxID=2685869 RepID=UPI001A9E43B6|nr:GNAT family N-acetyltransferase [Nocardioides ochotonae]